MQARRNRGRSVGAIVRARNPGLPKTGFAVISLDLLERPAPEAGVSAVQGVVDRLVALRELKMHFWLVRLDSGRATSVSIDRTGHRRKGRW